MGKYKEWKGLNIGLFTETYYPEINGVANSVYMLKTELEKIGHNVYVFTTTTPGAPEHEYNVFRVPSLPCVLISERRVGLFYQPRLAHIIRRLDLDIIHTHTEFSLGVFGRIMARELKIPVVHTYHTIYEDYTHYVNKFRLASVDERARAFVRMYTKICCNTVEQVIVPTKKVRELLMSYQVVKDIEVIPTGVDLEKFDGSDFTEAVLQETRKSFGIAGEDKVILYLGRVSSEKNIAELLKAMPEYMERHKDVKFLLVGDGPERERLERQVRDYSCRSRIIFAGQQPWDTVAVFYRFADVFVSASNSETQGLTYIEAMASGLPVVAREDPCLEDILVPGSNGFTFTEQKGFLEGLDQVLYREPENGAGYGENARRMVQKYSAVEFAKRVEKVYSGMLNYQRQGSALPID